MVTYDVEELMKMEFHGVSASSVVFLLALRLAWEPIGRPLASPPPPVQCKTAQRSFAVPSSRAIDEIYKTKLDLSEQHGKCEE